MNWEELIEEKAAPLPEMTWACDCSGILVQVVPNSDGLCPHCGYYSFREPVWNINSAKSKRGDKVHKVRLDGVETRGRKYNLAKAKQVIELRAQGLTIKQISAKLNIGVSSVHKYIHDRRSTG